MNLLDTILNSQNGAAVQQLGDHLGLGSDQTVAALSALVPALAGGVHQNAQTPDGLSGLVAALTGGSHQQYLDNPAALAHADTIADGNAILGHVFGSKDVSREVAAQASAQTGLGADVLQKMLPMAAALVMGALARHHAGAVGAGGSTTSSLAPGAGGDLMSVIASTLGQGGAGAPAGGIDIGGLLGRFLGR